MSARRLTRSLPLAAAILTGIAVEPVRAAVDSLRLHGQVLSRCTLDLDVAGVALNLTQGAAELELATVGESCNNQDGYTITLSSLMGGALATGAGERAGYTVSYGDMENHALSKPMIITHKDAQRGDVNRKLKVTVPPNRRALSGDYYDIITIAIAAR